MRTRCREATRLYSALMPGSGILAVGPSEFLLVLILLCLVVAPIAAIAFARSGRRYEEIGKGRFAVDFDDGDEAPHEEEIRQLVEAKAYRQSRRGEQPVDVEAEVDRLLAGEPDPADAVRDETALTPHQTDAPRDPEMDQIRDEIRQIVIAGNERRERRGEAPLDVEAEVERMLSEFG